MHKLKELDEEFKEKRVKLTEEYSKSLEDLLAERGLLNVIVVRKEDGVTGVFTVRPSYFIGSTTPQIAFYRITKKGTLSVNADEYIPTYTEKDPLDKYEPIDKSKSAEYKELENPLGDSRLGG